MTKFLQEYKKTGKCCNCNGKINLRSTNDKNDHWVGNCSWYK